MRKIYITEQQYRQLILNESQTSRQVNRGYVMDNMQRNKKLVSNITFISYGTDEFNPEKTREVELDADCQFVMFNNKPWGGIWGSPIDAENGWADFVEREDFNLASLSEFFKFKVDRSADIYVIDTLDDLINISTRDYRYNSFSKKQVYAIDFEALCDMGCNGVYITDHASRAFHSQEISLSKYNLDFNVCGLIAWDVCSICVFSPEFVNEIRENSFEKASFPKRGIMVDDEMLDDEWRADGVKDRYKLQMQSDFEKYGNQNVRDNMAELFGGKGHPAILAQGHGNSKDTQLARKFTGTIDSGLKK